MARSSRGATADIDLTTSKNSGSRGRAAKSSTSGSQSKSQAQFLDMTSHDDGDSSEAASSDIIVQSPRPPSKKKPRTVSAGSDIDLAAVEPSTPGPSSASVAGIAMAPESTSKPNPLFVKALQAAKEARSTPKAAATTRNSDAGPTPQSQFIGQEDFISFEASPEPEPASRSRGGRGPAVDAGGSGGRKRKLDEFEERREEGTRNLQKRERERSTPWCDEPGVDWKRANTATKMLNLEAKAFIHYISPTPVEHELRLTTIELIRRTIQSRWSDADIQCFGSVGTGLYLPGGDIDLVILCPTMPSPPLKPSSSLLHRVASLLLASSLAEPSSIVVISKARVPIVKFVTRYGGFSVDLSINQKNGVDAAVRVRGMLEDFAFREDGYVEPGDTVKTGVKGKGKDNARESESVSLVDQGVARSLVLLVKAFLNQRGMNEVFTGGLGSYSIICLVVSFLQLHPKIQTGEINPCHNVGLLFVEFLEYYGKHFNYDEAGITLRGRGGYFNKHNKGWYRPNQPYLLSIEDPNDPTNDVSGGSHNIIRVRQTLAGAFESITATLAHRVSHFDAVGDPSVVPLTDDALPNADYDATNPLCQSVLGSIIGMSRASIRARAENIRLYEDGVLQSLLGNTLEVGAAPTTSKKALKKARKEERERRKRDKTMARLEMRQGEREAKQERKERKKRELESRLAPMSSSMSREPSRDSADPPSFVIDTVGAQAHDASAQKLHVGTPQATGDAEEDSRYSIGSPGATVVNAAAAYKARSTASSRAQTPLYVNSRNSDSDSSDDGHDDGDVLLGGGSGDIIMGGKSAGDASSSEASDDQDDQVASQLVPKPVALRKSATAANKKAAKAAYWAAKGPVDDDI